MEKKMDLKTTDQSFAEDVLKSTVPVLVDFWAPWCGPCRMAGPIIDSVAGRTQGKAKVFKLNVDENPATACEYGISGIPTVLIFKNGTVEKQLVGVQSEETYLDALK
jgi:thioredoxin 1